MGVRSFGAGPSSRTMVGVGDDGQSSVWMTAEARRAAYRRRPVNQGRSRGVTKPAVRKAKRRR